MVATKEAWLAIWVNAVGVVVAETDDGWRDFAEALEPRKEALAVWFSVDSVEIIDEVAWDEDIIWLFGFGDFDEIIKRFVGDFWRKMNVADKEKGERAFDGGIIEAIASVIEEFHCYYYTIIF